MTGIIEGTVAGGVFEGGHELLAGEATGDISESALRRIQIREAVKAHFEKEQALFAKGVKVLSLFFIDTVSKYRSYTNECLAGHQQSRVQSVPHEPGRLHAEGCAPDE
jgi:type III restriction enzyme